MIPVFIVPVGGIKRDSLSVLLLEFQFRLLFGRMHLYRKHLLYIQHFKKIGELPRFGMQAASQPVLSIWFSLRV